MELKALGIVQDIEMSAIPETASPPSDQLSVDYTSIRSSTIRKVHSMLPNNYLLFFGNSDQHEAGGLEQI